MAGRILGESIEATGPIQTCRLGIALETRAMKMYRKFIMNAWVSKELRNTLLEYLLDEEFHTLWMKDYLRQIQI
jgi:bacterioferritin (cytochrome b1)